MSEHAVFRAYVTNLGKYNEGELVGEWVEFPIDEDEFEQILSNIGIGAKDEFGQPYDEWFVTDYDCNLNGFNWQDLGEYPSYDTLQEFGELIDSIDDVEAVDNVYEYTGDLEEAIEGLEDGTYIFIPDINSDNDLGWYVVDELYGGVENLGRDNIERYFDYEALGRDLDFDMYGDDDEQTAGEYWCGDEDASDTEIGEAFVAEVGIDNVGNAENYFNYEAFGRDVRFEGHFEFTTDGAVEIY